MLGQLVESNQNVGVPGKIGLLHARQGFEDGDAGLAAVYDL